MRAALPGLGAGSSGSRLLHGHDRAFERIETLLAAFCGAEAALLFGSGYAANQGLLQVLAGPDDLVLSDDAVVDTKPELQILADDVRCTHGATIGQLDAESLFYLQSRGIGKEDARNLLVFAFAQDVVDRIKVQSLRDSLEKILFEKFHEHAE